MRINLHGQKGTMFPVRKKRRGPCFHCGISHTPLWRIGPPEKPVLCNACGSRWRIWGNLDDYTPKHGFMSFISTTNRRTRSREQAGLEDNVGNGSESGSALPSSDSCIQSENINKTATSGLVEHSLWNAHVPRRKRSVLEQYALSRVGWLHRQLYDIQELEFSKKSSEQEDVLFFQKSKISSAEIGLGCLLLKSTASSQEESKESHS